jgi:FkbM family methyltransferase
MAVSPIMAVSFALCMSAVSSHSVTPPFPVTPLDADSWIFPGEKPFEVDVHTPWFSPPAQVQYPAGQQQFRVVDFWPVLPSTEMSSSCVVYSFGIGGDFGYEDYMASQGCEVHAFDPTAELREAHQSHSVPNVHFHYMGLTGKNATTQKLDLSYGTIDPSLLKDLPTIMNLLNHTHLDVLKIDCEGCEWDALTTLSKEDLATKVKLLNLEIHFSDLHHVPPLQSYLTLFETILDSFKIFFRHDNQGGTTPVHTSAELMSAGLPDNQCCIEYAFWNIGFSGGNAGASAQVPMQVHLHDAKPRPAFLEQKPIKVAGLA